MFEGMVQECAKIAVVIMETSDIELDEDTEHALIPYESDTSDRAIWKRMKSEVMEKEIRIINNSQKRLSDVPSADFIVIKNSIKLALKHCQNCNGPAEGQEFYCETSDVLDKLDISF